MKAELTPELKERFFAQYWGQNVIQKENTERLSTVCGVTQQLMECSERWLLLRPILSITDEEAIEINSILHPNQFADKQIIIVWITMLIKAGKGTISVFGRALSLELSDYLRSIGVALPFMGHSVEDLAKAGWIRLTEQ